MGVSSFGGEGGEVNLYGFDEGAAEGVGLPLLDGAEVAGVLVVVAGDWPGRHDSGLRSDEALRRVARRSS
jgi:hypothetical protein